MQRGLSANVDPGCCRRFGVGTGDLNDMAGGRAFEFFAQPADSRAKVCKVRGPAGLAHSWPVSAATDARQDVVGRQPNRRVAGLTADQRLARPACQHTGSSGDVADTDNREVGVADPVDQRRGDERLLPRLFVRSIDNGDLWPGCPLARERRVDHT